MTLYFHVYSLICFKILFEWNYCITENDNHFQMSDMGTDDYTTGIQMLADLLINQGADMTGQFTTLN